MTTLLWACRSTFMVIYWGYYLETDSLVLGLLPSFCLVFCNVSWVSRDQARLWCTNWAVDLTATYAPHFHREWWQSKIFHKHCFEERTTPSLPLPFPPCLLFLFLSISPFLSFTFFKEFLYSSGCWALTSAPPTPPQSPQCWDYKHVPPLRTNFSNSLKVLLHRIKKKAGITFQLQWSNKQAIPQKLS